MAARSPGKKTSSFPPRAETPSERKERLKDEECREEERGLTRRAFWANRAYRSLWKSTISHPGSRSDPLLDRAILQLLTEKTKKGAVFAIIPAPGRPVLLKGVSRKSNKKKKSPSAKRGRATDYRLRKLAATRLTTTPDLAGDPMPAVRFPTWDHVSEVIKGVAYGAAIHGTDKESFSLNLTEAVISAALKSKKGFAGFFQDRIAKSLKKAMPAGVRSPDFVFAVEGCWYQGCVEIEPFHLHGVIGLPEMEEDLYDRRETVKGALREAGGKMPKKTFKAKISTPRQLDMRRTYNVLGWVAYMNKLRLSTQAALGAARKARGLKSQSRKESLIGATSRAKRSGQQWFEQARRSGEPVIYEDKCLSRRSRSRR